MIPSLPPTSASGTLAPQTVSSVRLLLEGGKALLDASTLPARLPPLMLGEQVEAQVVDSKNNGQQLSVLIKNSLFNLDVPQGMTISGNTLSLKVATLAPTLSFALQEQATEAAQDGSVEVQLSPASKYLTGMLQTSKPSLPATDVSLNAASQRRRQRHSSSKAMSARVACFTSPISRSGWMVVIRCRKCSKNHSRGC